MKKGTKIRRIVLICCLICSMTSIVSGIIVFNLQSGIEFDPDGSYYSINNQGNLLIHLKGKIVNKAPADCVFQLTIPEEYEMASLSDGTPAIELFNGGAPLETTITKNQFHSIFMLNVYKTTALPMNYTLKISSLGANSEQIISPKWGGGGGASVSADSRPFITSFYAYDSYKGNSEQVSTYIYNPDPFFDFWLYGMSYKIDADGYTDFHDWTPEYSENTPIYPRETIVVIDYLNPIFTGSSGKYALNAGIYNVTSVKARGGAWTDYFTPSTSQGQFVVSVQSGTHPVFVLHLVDQNFRDHFNENIWFDSLEEHNFKMYDLWFGRVTDLKAEFGINFKSLVLSWSPGTTNLYTLYNYKIRQDAGSLIGKIGSWKGVNGTSSTNHGFDLLFGHVYLKNTYSGTIEDYKGAGYCAFKNYAVLMRSSVIGWVIEQNLGTMHETLHSYECQHVSAPFYIMNPDLLGWVMHASTESTLDDHITYYDGA